MADDVVTPMAEEIDDMNIRHGEVLTDRKSAFQAHLAEVRSKEDVSLNHTTNYNIL